MVLYFYHVNKYVNEQSKSEWPNAYLYIPQRDHKHGKGVNSNKKALLILSISDLSCCNFVRVRWMQIVKHTLTQALWMTAVSSLCSLWLQLSLLWTKSCISLWNQYSFFHVAWRTLWVGLNLHLLPVLNHVEHLPSETHNIVFLLVLGFFPLFPNYLSMNIHYWLNKVGISVKMLTCIVAWFLYLILPSFL